MRQEGRGIGLLNKLRHTSSRSRAGHRGGKRRLGFAPDLRDYGIGAQILADLGLATIRLMTNNPRKIVGLEGYGFASPDGVRWRSSRRRNLRYLRAKKDKMGHILDHQGPIRPGRKGPRGMSESEGAKEWTFEGNLNGTGCGSARGGPLQRVHLRAALGRAGLPPDTA